MDTPKQEPRWLGNYHKDRREAILQASAESGQSVEWRDVPSELMPPSGYPDYGSIWSAEHDLSNFWRTYRRLIGAETRV